MFAESVGKCAGLILIAARMISSMNSKLFVVAGLPATGRHQALKLIERHSPAAADNRRSGVPA